MRSELHRDRRGQRAGPDRSCGPASTGCSIRDISGFIPGTGVLVETLLVGGSKDDVREAQAAIDKLVSVRFDDHSAVREIWLARPQMLTALAHGGEVTYRDFRERVGRVRHGVSLCAAT